LIDGSLISFDSLYLASLPGEPKIWKDQRILLKIGDKTNDKILKELLITDDITSFIGNTDYKIIEPNQFLFQEER